MLRQAIVATLGHVDAGKTSLLDAIRSSKVASRESGGITQHIGASEVPMDVVRKICLVPLAGKPVQLTLPGLLFIDTPGHEAFSNLRRRGGSIADIAVLVIDVTKGIEAQTVEAIEILREYKTPFIVALNKIDALAGWKSVEGRGFTEAIAGQREDVAARLDEKTYAIIGGLHKHGFSAERFDRVSDFTQQIVMVPVSARSREGIAELLMFVAGLAQRFLGKNLTIEEDSEGKASVLEIREERGLGMTIDAILYDGVIKEGDPIVFASQAGAVESRVKALLKPKALDEMRDPKEKFKPAEFVSAAAGIKISCDRAGEALAGGPLLVARTAESLAAAKVAVEKELKEILFESEKNGAIVRADALGSVEAITKLLSAQGISIRRAAIGSPSKRDVLEAGSVGTKNQFEGVIFAFNVPIEEDVAALAKENGVKVFSEKIIYNLVEGYRQWVADEKAREKREAFTSLFLPAKIKILKGCCFRVSKPCIVGVEVLGGTLKAGAKMLNEAGEKVGELKQIQRDKEAVQQARKGEQIAVSIEGPTFGRQVCESETLYADVPKDDQLLLEGKYRGALSDEDFALLQETKKVKGLRA